MAIVGIITLLWMSLLLAISYFVLLTAEKAPEKIKGFGKFVGTVLIVVSLVIAVSGIAMLFTGTNPMDCMSKQGSQCPMMGGMKGGMRGMHDMKGMSGKMKEGKMTCPKMKGAQPPAQKDDTSPIKCQ